MVPKRGNYSSDKAPRFKRSYIVFCFLIIVAIAMEPQLVPLFFTILLANFTALATVVYHLVPFTPFMTRFLLCSRFRPFMRIDLTDTEKNREASRTVILGLIGVSFTGLLALTVVDAKIDLKTFFPVYYMLISFLCFIASLNLQSYKRYRWHNIFDAGLIEAAVLSILLAITAIIWSSNQASFYKVLLSALAFGTWLADHYIRLRILRIYLNFLAARARSAGSR